MRKKTKWDGYARCPKCNKRLSEWFTAFHVMQQRRTMYCYGCPKGPEPLEWQHHEEARPRA